MQVCTCPYESFILCIGHVGFYACECELLLSFDVICKMVSDRFAVNLECQLQWCKALVIM